MANFTYNGKFGLSLLTADLNPSKSRRYWINQRVNQLTRELKEQLKFMEIDKSKERQEYINAYKDEIKAYKKYLNQ